VTHTEIVYRPCTGATRDSEIAVLADVYRFVLDTAMKEGCRPGPPDAAKGSQLDRTSEKHAG
jgi:hypothetical protein